MTKTPIIVIGAGGHSKVASEIISSSSWEIIAYIDEGSTSATFLGKPVFKTLALTQSSHPTVRHAFVAIGDNVARSRWSSILLENDYTIPHFTHPSASVSPSAELSQGVLVCAMAVVGPSAKVGDGTIVNCGAIVDHDSTVGRFTHLSQGVVIAGGAQVGSNSLVGPGSIIEKLAVVPGNTALPSATVVETARK
ncbi:hypothetical protein AB1A81_07750 [Bdellovibrio bacteriovorus]|uniref:Putative acetyltransferase n=1 Tax=Bdellovibrio bacteriovorus (strain ATCC 15356 / DSM 50701 / NCIMB 9529 / HD100) TaxID=264462 RepID=Q6MMD6_BDEBA|nr:acetyltransferase [Bdellovibrio bacteriovorus]CAE79569.1 putative acetyltransferase [Bdellovibrio bacteriovorus HD100]